MLIIKLVKVKDGGSEWFRIDSGVRRVYHVPLAFRCIYGCSIEGGEDGNRKERNEIPGGGERLEIACPLVCR